jgi:uncharacterized protein
MYLSDINVLVYAYASDMPSSDRYAEWLQKMLSAGEPFGMSDIVLAGFIRIVTNPKILSPRRSLDEAFSFVNAITDNPNCVRVSPGEKHWGIFLNLCKTANARGNLVSDAYLAALAIESDCEWVTTDADFARFPGLRWKHPLNS